MRAEHALAAVMVAGLVAYVLGGGADFGGGVWDVLATGPRAQAQRALVERAIGPIWEANHVWFVFVFVVLFSAFPPAFAEITTSLFGLLSLYAVGLVLRGSAFTFRHYATSGKRWFGAIFSGASIVCPWLLGAMGACLLRPRLHAGLDAFVVASGFFALALVAALAATYLTLEAEDPALKADFRVRALASLVVAGGASWIAYACGPVVHVGITAAASVLGFTALALVATRRFALARIAVGALAAAVVVGWATAKGEALTPGFTLEAARAHPGTLSVLLVAIGIGFVVLVPSLVLLYRVFAGAPRP